MKHLVLGGVLLVTLFSFSASFGAEAPENCKSYFDGCNNCSRQSIGSDLMCTMMWCETPTTPVCREYFPNTSTGTLACPEIYAPVCAQPPMPPCPAGMACIQVMPQPKTYSSECVAESEKATVLYTGACKDDAPITQCTGKYEPVCAKDPHRACPDGAQCLISDLRTYANECKAKADGATIVSVGACKGTPDANPPRACDLDALICPDGRAIGRTGPDCQFDCSAHQLDCPLVRDAVCGSDGKTYGNVCLAGGKEIAYKGKCLSTKTQASIRSILVGAIEKKTAHISNPGILATILENVAEKSDRLGDQATSELRTGVYHFASKVIYEYLQKKVYEPYLQSLKETIFPGEGGHTLEFIWNGNHSVGIQNHYQDMISVTQVQVGVKDQNLFYTIEE